jgi:hypothetical protein
LKLFEYISVLTSIIVGLGMAHLLRGLAGLVQHPGREKIYWVHLVWVGYMFFNMVFFWWWEFALAEIEVWLFQDYLFIVFYAVVLYLMSAMLFPRDLEEYDGFEDYFLSRRRWFFGLLAMTFFIDLYDTWLKGREHFESLGTDYFVMSVFYLTVAVVAIASKRQVVHAVIAVLAFSYQVAWSFAFWGQQG